MAFNITRTGPLNIAYLDDPAAEELAEYLVAMANTDGGTIIIGADAKGNAMPNPVHAEEFEGTLHSAETMCRPIIQASWESQVVPGGAAIVINVPKSIELHSLEDGRVLVRANKENKALTGEQIRHLSATKSTGDFETQTANGAKRSDFDDDVIAEYLEKREARQGKQLDIDIDEHLQHIGALDQDGNPTNAGVLCFAKHPQFLLSHSDLLFVKFAGTDPRGADGAVGYGRREEISGPLPHIIERAWKLILEEMAISATVSGLTREETTEYPKAAVREALVNAVCHRDYRLSGRRIEVRMFADRMEIISPGGLPGYITVDNIVEEHFSRNPRLVSTLFQFGYIEELGLGVDYMIEAMANAGQQPPKFEAKPHSFTVKLFNNRDRRPTPTWSNSMNERQTRALTYIREHGRITNREYRQLCPDNSPETLRLDLVDLVNRGVLLKIGAKKGTYYILK